jgi:hypothetical protein
MGELDGGAWLRVVPIDAATATTLTANTLRYGGVGNQKFSQKWIIRPEASASADRERYSTDYAPATGVITHAGANYSDTTSTSESIEISDYEPRRIDTSITKALQGIRRDYRCVIPSRPGNEWYSLHDFAWIEKPGDVRGVKLLSSPVLTKNRNFDDWSLYNTTSVLLPDFWTVNGSGGTVARSTTGARRSRYTAALTRAGTDTYLEQVIGLQWTGVATDSLQGRVVCAAADVYATVASRAYISITDGITETTSSAHTGGSTVEELTVAHTVSSTATTLAMRLHVKTGDTVATFDSAFCAFGTLTDAMRRDDYDRSASILHVDDSWFDTSGAPNVLKMRLPGSGYGRQFVLHAPRPFTQFVESRISAGTADADSTDAPLDVVATIALSNLYQGLAQDRMAGEAERAFYEFQRVKWQKAAEPLRRAHLYENPEHGVGADVLSRRKGLAPTVSRW